MEKKIIDSFDTTNLYLLTNKVRSPKGVFIIVHGLAEYCERYNYLVEILNQNNISVYRYDMRGHGKSGGKKGWVDNYNSYIKDLDQIVKIAKEENKDIPVFIMGHSMGGFITAAYGIQNKNKVEGIILSAAALEKPENAKGINSLLIKTFNKIYPTYEMKNDLGKLVSRDKKVVDKYIRDPLVLKKISIKLYYEFLIKGIEWLQKNIDKFEYNCLIIHGKEDKIVNYKSSVRFENKIKSNDKKIILYDNLYHEILNEKEKDNVIKDILVWIDDRI